MSACTCFGICKLEVCVHKQLTCVHKPMYANTYSCLETLVQAFSIFVSLYLLYDILLLCPYFIILSLCPFVCILVCFNMLD